MDKRDLMVLVGDNVRRYRMERKMTQGELAARVDRNDSAITRIESGKRMMSVSMLRAVADALDVSCDALLREPTASTRIGNITKALSGQSERNLASLERIVQVCIEEFGDEEDKSPDL